MSDPAKLVYAFLGLAWLGCSDRAPGVAPAVGGGGVMAGVAGAAGTGAVAAGGSGGTSPSEAGTAGTAGMVNEGGEAGEGPSDPVACHAGEVYGDPLAHGPQATNVHDGAVGFLEGPVWIAAQSTLYYSNFEGSGSNGRIRRHRPRSDELDVWLENVGANGLSIDAQGFLVAAFHQEQRLVRFDLATKAQVAVPGGDQYQGAPYNSINDVVTRADGHLYFTDPNYQRGERPGQPVAGSYHLTPEGVATLIDTQEAPNGIGLSPDERSLYVAGTGTPHPLMKYDLAENGDVTTPGTPISDLPSDGMAVDCAGNLYLSTGGGENGVITVLSPTGQLIGTIPIEAISGTTSATFGGPTHQTLFVTTNSGGLFQVPMVVPGLP